MLADRFSFLKQDRSLFSFFYILELSHPFQFYPIQYKIYDTTSLPQAALIPFIYETKLIQVSCQSYIKNIFSNKDQFWYTYPADQGPNTYRYPIFKSLANSLDAHMCNMGFPIIKKIIHAQKTGCPYRDMELNYM